MVQMLYGVRESACTELAGLKFEKPIFKGNIGGEVYEITRHPELLLSETATAWVRDFEYTEEFKIPVPYDDRHPCWLQMREEWRRIKGASSE